MQHSKMLLLMQLIFIVLAFIFHEHEAIAASDQPNSMVAAPINKHIDAGKTLYSAQIMTAYVRSQFLDANMIIDLDAPFTWHYCILRWNDIPDNCPYKTSCTYPLSCEEHECTEVRTMYSYQNPSCPPVTNDSTVGDWGYCTCPVNVVDPVTGSCGQALLNYDEFAMKPNIGGNVFDGFHTKYSNTACAPSSAFESFPANVSGVMALSDSPYALPAFLYDPLKRVIALCLPSNASAPGILLYGAGPYYLLPGHSDVDIRSLLSYTPLIKDSNSDSNSFRYFIRINSIVIKTRSIDVPTSATTKICTIEPYTALRTDIYNGLVRRFSKVTKRIPSATPVAPFGLCFSSSTNGTLKVPNIDFDLQDGKKWTISTANSIKQVTKDVACLAFVDGGATSEPAIVIGSFQLEDNFLVFDLEESRFGFSSSLLRKQTSCSSLNFTIAASNN